MQHVNQVWGGRGGLEVYIKAPEGNDRVVFYDHDVVLISDLYPKATMHLLLLPRDTKISTKHPLSVLNNTTVLQQLRDEKMALIKPVVIRQIRQSFPAGVDPELIYKDLRVGVHASPSMSNLHIHILTPDMHSPFLKRRQHYNSFCTQFFVPLADFPLPSDAWMRKHGRDAALSSDLCCWHCRENFGNSVAKLKKHLSNEFDSYVSRSMHHS